MKNFSSRRLANLLLLFVILFSGYIGPGEYEGFVKKKKISPEKEKFLNVIQGLEKQEGIFTFYRGKKNLYLELKPDQLDKEYIFLGTLEKALGVQGFLGGLPLDEFIVVFRQVEEEKVFFIRKNPYFQVKKDDPLKRAVEHAFSDSLLAVFPVVAKNPDTQSILIDFLPFLLSDYFGLQSALKQWLNSFYKVNGDASYLSYFKVFPENAEFSVLMNYQTEEGVYVEGIPDPRNFWLGIRYSISTFPQTSDYVPRYADDRVGHFYVAIKDFSQKNPKEPFVRYIIRWNLKKAKPEEELSPPVKPIVFWVENSTPPEYRQAVIEGILMWNKAFEEIGFRNAIEARIQPDDADWDPADVRYNTVRWITSSDVSFAGIGPARINPITGEILDADVLIEGEAIRGIQWLYKLQIEPRSLPVPRQGIFAQWGCEYSALLAQEASFGLFAHFLRTGDEGVPQDFVNDYIRELVAHEIGHVLGLRHNFKGSLWITDLNQLHQTDLTSERGLSSSVMDYLPVNISPPGVKQGDFFSRSIGPYDFWAIEYAYTQTGAKTPDEELPILEKIASKAGQRELLYATDEDTFGWSTVPDSGDPYTQWWDLSADPISFAESRIALAQELKGRILSHFSRKSESFEDFRYALNSVFGLFNRGAHMLAKFIGGVEFLRIHPEPENGKSPLRPIPYAVQKRALSLLEKEIFSDEPFALPPEILQKAQLTRWLHWGQEMSFFEPVEYPYLNRVSRIREGILSRLLHPKGLWRMQRVKEMQGSDKKEEVLDIPYLFERLDNAVWQDLWSKPKEEIFLSSMRKEFQVIWVKQLISLYSAQGSAIPSEAKTSAGFLLNEIARKIGILLASGPQGWDRGTYQHLAELKALIERVLNAQVVFPLP
ncbi:MAG: zinc-dependent metalloprotease [bacterium JZ-2024 1]